MPVTLSIYIARQLLQWFAALILIAAVMVLLLDSMELVRRAASRPEVGIGTIAQMALLHLPHILDIVLPFAMLFAAMAALWRLSRHQELAVARAAGLSIWQLLLPALLTAILIGLFKVLAFNPVAAASLALFEDFEVQYFDRRPNNPVLQGSGLWLKDYSGEADLVVHAKSLRPRERVLETVSVFEFVDRDRFAARFDAKSGTLNNGEWRLSDVQILRPNQQPEAIDSITFATRLTWSRLEESFASPASMPVWRLPRFIQLLEDAGFSAAPHRVHLHASLAAPLTMSAMVLIAAGLALRPPRRGGILALMTAAAVAGLGFHLLTQIFLRLGLSAQLPAALSAWAPVGCITMLGAAWLLYTEDG